MPGAGGAYVYLREAFVAVSLAQYGQYLWPEMTVSEDKLVAAFACLVATALLYRDTRQRGHISVGIFLLVTMVAVWIIVSGLGHFHARMAFDFPPGAFSPSLSFFSGLGTATLIAVLDYGGYATVCFCGGEVQQPSRTIPLSILYSIGGVAVFYTLATIMVIGVIPWRQAAQSRFVVSDFIARLHGPRAAQFLTMMVLIATFGCLFTSLLSFSRVLYAGAVDGQFFPIFARLHPRRRFPSGSVIVLGAMSSILCVLPLATLLKAAMGIATLTQYLPQTVAALVIRRNRPDIALPFRMWMYPVPAWVALAGWLFVLLSNERGILLIALAIAALGIGTYLLRAS